jgi:hypothetical protein
MGLPQMRFLLIIPIFISNTGVRATEACVESRLKRHPRQCHGCLHNGVSDLKTIQI